MALSKRVLAAIREHRKETDPVLSVEVLSGDRKGEVFEWEEYEPQAEKVSITEASCVYIVVEDNNGAEVNDELASIDDYDKSQWRNFGEDFGEYTVTLVKASVNSKGQASELSELKERPWDR